MVYNAKYVAFARAMYVVCMCVLLLYIANVASTIYYEPTIHTNQVIPDDALQFILSYVAAMEDVDEIQTPNYTQAHSQTHNY